MAAASAMPYCVAHRDSESPELRNPRLRIGLDDGGEKAGYMFLGSRERCDSVCMERGTCKPATPPLSWVRVHNPLLRASTFLALVLCSKRAQLL